MKLTHKLCGAVLLSIVGFSVAAPTASAVNSKTGNADIEFKRNTTGIPDVTKPGTSNSTITNIPDVTNPGDFGIVAVTPLDFESHDVLTGSAAREYYAAPFVANKGKTDEYKVENFVKFLDERSVIDHKYSLSAALTKNFTGAAADGTAVVLEGAELTFKNMNLTTLVDPALKPATPVLNQGTTLKFGESAKPFYVNNEASKGKGSYELTFGNQDAGTTSDAIKISIPSSTDVFESKYNATITWTLAETL